MNDNTVLIPKANDDESNYPCWHPVVVCANTEEVNAARDKGMLVEPIYRPTKPYIMCKCGQRCGIGLHHVHADGKVWASFYHYFTDLPADHPRQGCGWHEFIKLLDYDNGEFPPNVT